MHRAPGARRQLLYASLSYSMNIKTTFEAEAMFDASALSCDFLNTLLQEAARICERDNRDRVTPADIDKAMKNTCAEMMKD